MSYLSIHRVRVLATAAVIGATGCATIVKGGSGELQFRDVPKLEGDESFALWVDGQPAKWPYRESGTVGDMVEYQPAVYVTTASEHQVCVQVGGCAAEFRVGSSISAWWVDLDFFVGLGIGAIVDWATGDWRELDGPTVLSTPGFMAERGKPVGNANPKIPCGTNPARVTRSHDERACQLARTRGDTLGCADAKALR